MDRAGGWMIGMSLLALATFTACGGGGGGVVNTGGGSTVLAAGFVADQPNPGANSVSLQQGSVSGSMVTIDVVVTDTVDLTGATFDLRYDSATFSYITSSAGGLFENAGANPISAVNEPAAGHLVVGIGAASAVPVNGSQDLIRLTFRADAAGTGAVTVELGDLQDTNSQSVPGVTWSAGTLTGS